MKQVLVILFVLALSVASLGDPQADYERLKADIQQHRRDLNQLVARRQYKEAIALQDTITEMSEKALEMALKHKKIGDAGALNYHSSILNDMGRFERALDAVDRYMQVPLLDRNQKANGWRRRAEIHRRSGQGEQALAAYAKVLTLAERPRDRFNAVRDRAKVYLDLDRPEEALSESKKLPDLVKEIEEDKRDQAERDLENLRQQIYRELGDAAKARQAKKRELELRKTLLEEELAQFDHKYPEDD